ncbi:MAG: D-glycero-beta-D-manno-heptose 1-phosphate adenylyltransferase, partial [Deltaproteobacteria bacterium]|nr:D-glycero-beta-D-manno-heptose 1-phosphate adenylyltransferase [Deltaproteobacteria bacterium]
MQDKIVSAAEAKERVAGYKNQGLTVVFTNGCFDILHAGHVRYLAEAREKGDVLVVGVNSDRSVSSIKGRGRPLVPLRERAEVLAALESVSLVVPFDEDTPERLIEALAPHVLVKGADWPEDKIAGAAAVRAAGGEVVRVPLSPGLSTTGIIKKILETFKDGPG